MAERSGQKIKLLYLAELLWKYTDEEHPMPAAELCEELAKRGVTAERKAIYNDIAVLTDFGFDIVQTRLPRAGYFLASREFEPQELYLLTDAVRSAKFISAKKTRELLRKLDSLCSVYQAKRRGQHTYIDSDGKCDNEELYRTIDNIAGAIEERRKLSLIYGLRQLGEGREITVKPREMKISPYALTWQDDHYYLIGNYGKYDNLIHLRIDRMRHVEMTDEPARPYSEVSEYTEFFDVADYTRRLFSMHGGRFDQISLRCSRGMIEQVVDRFSDRIFLTDVSEDKFSFSVKAAVSEALVTWIINYGDAIEVLSPPTLRQAVIDRAKQVLGVYGQIK